MKRGMKRMKRGRTGAWSLALAAATVMFVAARGSAATEYVSATSTNPVPPYATPATAANNIQDAVNVANNGDTVLVEPGTYTLSNQVTVTKAITLRSTAGAGQTLLNVEGNIWCLWISNLLAVVDGFTMTNSSGDHVNAGGIASFGATILNCTITNFILGGPGPGIITMAGGVLSNSVVSYRLIPPGFFPIGVYCTGGGLVTDCQVLEGGAGNGGPGVYLENSQMRDSLVTGGGPDDDVASPDSAVSAVSSTITGCTISHHGTGSPGGGANLNNCLMDRCIIAFNGSYFIAGGIFETNSTIRNSLIVSNSATVPQPNSPGCRGGGVYMHGGALVNCTVGENGTVGSEQGPGQGGGVYVESGGITNSIIYFNNSSVGANWANAGTGVFDHACTTPDPGGTGNLVEDPQFVNSTNGNFHLATNSPCIGAGVVQSWMTGAADLDGNPRTANGTVDMGSYQSQTANQPHPVAIANSRLVGQSMAGGFAFSFPTQTNRTYTIQYTFSLAPANWQTLATVPGDGAVMSYTNQVTGSPNCYYRVLAQ